VQWILLLVGLVLGWSAGGALDESLIGATLGALIGFALGLSIRLSGLSRRSAEQQKVLTGVQAEVASLQQRLALMGSPKPEPEPEPAPVATLQAVPELIWDLPVDTPVPPEPTRPAAIPDHGPIYRAIAAAKNWLFGGNTVLRVGVVLLFLGLAFLLRYATEGMVVPIEMRYAGVAAAAVALLGLGWWLRQRNSQFALMLQGTGIGVLYLTVFAAMKLHPLLDPTLAFGLLVVVTAFSAILAVTQNSLALACAAALGGFAAPLLTSTGTGSHVALFSYFALLNAGIFAIAWFKAWRLLNLIGFVGTFGIGFTWGLRAYTPELLWSTEPFLILFFLMYLAIGLLFARRKLQELGSGPEDDSREAVLRWSARQGDYVDGSLLFGTPIVGFGLQFALVQHLEFAASFSALALGILYMGIARVLAARKNERTLLLTETCLALGVVFATLAIPLGLDAQWTTAAWAVEGTAVFWLGLRQQRLLARGFGLLLQLAAGLVFFNELHAWYSPLLAHGDFWTPMIISLAALISALLLHRIGGLTRLSVPRLSAVLLVWGAGWWALSLLSAVLRFTPVPLQPPMLLILTAASVALWAVLALRLNWPGLAMLCTLLTPLSGVVLLLSLGTDFNPAANWGWLAWLAVFSVHLVSLRRLAPLLPQTLAGVAHALGCWLIISVLSLALRYGLMQLSDHYNAWRWLGWALLPSIYLLAMSASRPWPWPVAAYPRAYRFWAAAPLAVLMLAWFWLANFFSDGAADPLPYVPLINPLELGLLFALFGIFTWMRKNAFAHESASALKTILGSQRAAFIVAGASLFALFTAMVMRSAHHWSDVPWHLDDLLESMRVQAGLSIVWTLMALALMIGGHLRVRREVWIVGAALIGVVVAKLFFVELSNRGGMARIVSFIGVGILLLVVGYFAPLPPKATPRPLSPAEADPSESPQS